MWHWFAVNTYARAENKARVNLERQGFEVYLPCYMKERRHARRVDRVLAPLFPRYLFVGMDMGTARWRPINSTIGVSRMVTSGRDPLRVPNHIIEAIRSRENDDGFVELSQVVPFRKGCKVRVLGGPLKDQIGLFDCADDTERVFILLDLMGRVMKVRINVEQVSALQ